MNQTTGCALIGEGTLPLACAEMLAARGLPLRAVVTQDATLLAWAAARGVPCTPDPAGLAGLLRSQRPALLFSIGNERLVPEDILGLFATAINYHDGPLPRYAGRHVTSWALMARETAYAVSWHLMTGATDAGDLLRQTPVAISEKDNALTLNARCYEAALRGFALLLDDLLDGSLRPTPQDRQQRSYFPRARRPANGAVIDWRSSAQEIDALWRALDFGAYPNPLGCAKVLLDGCALVPQSLEVLAARSDAPPGSVVAIDAGRLRVSTGTHDVTLGALRGLDGRSVVADQLKLKAGDRLPLLDAADGRRLTESLEQLAASERFWVRRLAGLDPLGVPYIAGKNESATPPQCSFELPAELAGQAAKRGDTAADLLVHVLLVYLARINGRESFGIGWQDGKTAAGPEVVNRFFAGSLPLQAQLDADWTLERCLQASRTELALLRRHRSYALDAVLRYPELRGAPAWLVKVECGGAAAAGVESPGPELLLRVAPDATSFMWIDRGAAFSPAQLGMLGEQFLACLAACLQQPQLPLSALPLTGEAECTALRQLAGAAQATSVNQSHDA